MLRRVARRHVTTQRIGDFIKAMPVLALAFVALLVWLVVKRGSVPPAARTAGLVTFGVVCAAPVAIRAGPRGILVFAVGLVALGVWLALRGWGGDDRRDDGPDVPDPPEPDPGPGQRVDLPPEVLDPEAFDRARAEWERELPKRG
jgi:hypothetical protein